MARGCRMFLAALAVVLAADLATMAYGVLRGPFPVAVALGAPTAYLNLYVHVPLAITSYVVFTVALVAAALYLWRREERWDELAYSAIIVGELYGVFTILTGMAWARESWGAAWNWDPPGRRACSSCYSPTSATSPSAPACPTPRGGGSWPTPTRSPLVPLSYAAPLVFESLHPSFREAQSFAWTGPAAALMGARVLLAVATGVLLAQAPYRVRVHGCPTRPLKALAAAALVATAALAAGLALPYLAGDPVRVVDAGLSGDGGLEYVVLSNGTTLVFEEPVESPVKPAATSDGRPSIIGHVVVVEGDELRVVRHWSVAFNVAMYGVLIASSLAAAAYSARRA